MKRAGLVLALALAGCVSAPHAPVAGPPVPESAPAAAPVPAPEQAFAGPEFAQTRAALAAAGTTLADVTAGRTLLAPTDAAWARLPPGTAEALLRPENRPSLVRLLRFWTLPGRITLADLRARAVAGARLPTGEGEPIALTLTAEVPTLTDAMGRRAYAKTEYLSEGGAVLGIDGIVAPKSIEPGAGA